MARAFKVLRGEGEIWRENGYDVSLPLPPSFDQSTVWRFIQCLLRVVMHITEDPAPGIQNGRRWIRNLQQGWVE